MVLSKQVIGDVSVDIIVDYNFNIREVEEVISIIFIDAYDGSEIETSVLLCKHFPSAARYLVDTINWEEVYNESVNNLKNDI